MFALGPWINSFGKVRAKQVEVDELAEDSVIIAVVGPTGSGKSAFINTATGYQKGVGHGLEPCTSDITIVKLSFPELVSTDVFFVDTPGFDGTKKTDTEVFDMIKSWLNARSKRNIKLSGLLYFHRISDNRMGSTPLKTLQMVEQLCGSKLPYTILTTTMWDEVDDETGEMREKELKEVYWKCMIARGSRTDRFTQTTKSALQILARILDATNTREALFLRKEMIDLGFQLRETSAGRKLFSGLEQLVKRQQEMLERIRDELKKASPDQDELQALMEEYQKITKNLASTSDQMKEMKIAVGARLGWATKMVFGWASFKGSFEQSTKPLSRASVLKPRTDEPAVPSMNHPNSGDFIQVDGAEDNQSFQTAPNSPHDNDDEPPPSEAAAERKPVYGSELMVPSHDVARISHRAAGAGSQGPSDKAQGMSVYNPEPKVGYRSAGSNFQPPAAVGTKADAPVALRKPVGQPETASAIRNPRGLSHPTVLVPQSRQNGVQQMPANRPEAHLATRPNVTYGHPEGTVTRERLNEAIQGRVNEPDFWLGRSPGVDETRRPPPASIPQGQRDGPSLPVPEKPTSPPRRDEKRSQGKGKKPQPSNMDPDVKQVALQPSLQHVSAQASPHGANRDADRPQGFPEKPILQAQVRPNNASPAFPNPKSSASLAPISNTRPSLARLCKDEDAASARAILAELRNQLTGMVPRSNLLGGGLAGERQEDDLNSDLEYMKYRVNRVRQDLDHNSMGPRTVSKEEERRWIEREVLSLLCESIPEAERKVKVCDGGGDTT